jgi:hypothetical protein
MTATGGKMRSGTGGIIQRAAGATAVYFTSSFPQPGDVTDWELPQRFDPR